MNDKGNTSSHVGINMVVWRCTKRNLIMNETDLPSSLHESIDRNHNSLGVQFQCPQQYLREVQKNLINKYNFDSKNNVN